MAECLGSIHVLAARATRLAADGSPVESATASVVTGNPMRIGFNPEVEEGEDRTQKNGAGCVCLAYREPDYIKWWNFEMDNCRLEPALFELMFRADLILDGEGEPIGNILPSGGGNCDLTQGGIGFEFWTRAWDDGAVAATPYIRWIVPKSIWTLGDNEFSPEFATITASGFSENNPQFGDPYEDQPATFSNPDGRVAYFYDTVLPTPACDYAALPASGS